MISISFITKEHLLLPVSQTYTAAGIPYRILSSKKKLRGAV
jgi:hypothetical protein